MLYIYGLICPVTQQIRYIGKAKDVKNRLKQHLSDSGDTHKVRWLSSLKRQGLVPSIEIIETIEDEKSVDERERYWISFYRPLGWLTNETGGGDGVSNPSERVRELWSRQRKGKKQSEKTRQKRSASLLGNQNAAGHSHPQSESSRKRIAAAKLGDKNPQYGRTVSAERRSWLSSIQLGTSHNLSREGRKSIARSNAEHPRRKGKKHSEETLRKMRMQKIVWHAIRKALQAIGL